MIEHTRLDNQTDYCCMNLKGLDTLVESIALSLSSIRAANLKDIRGHQALVHASAFLGKKYEEYQQVVPSRTQLDSYVAEFNRGSFVLCRAL